MQIKIEQHFFYCFDVTKIIAKYYLICPINRTLASLNPMVTNLNLHKL